jgi:hypothetical protein
MRSICSVAGLLVMGFGNRQWIGGACRGAEENAAARTGTAGVVGQRGGKYVTLLS